MNKQELTIVVLLFVLLFAWSFSRKPRPTPPSSGTEPVAEEQSEALFAAQSPDKDGNKLREAATASQESKPGMDAWEQTDSIEAPNQTHHLDEKIVVLFNDEANVIISSWGGSITSVELKNYRATVDKDSGPIRLDFSDKPALSLTGIPGMSVNNDFMVSVGRTEMSSKIEITLSSDLHLERTISLKEDYLLEVTDVFSNNGTEPVLLPKHSVALGPMQIIETKTTTRGISYLGLDTMGSAGGSHVVYWSKKGPDNDDRTIAKRFLPEHLRGWGCPMSKSRLKEPMPPSVTAVRTADTDWLAAKNKFFVQLLAPEGGGNGFVLNAARDVPETEDPDNGRTWAQAASLEEVSADMRFRESTLQPGESFTRKINYYVGPKKHSALKKLGNRQDEIMFRTWRGWGWFRSVCVALLWTLNAIYKVIPDYGVAIILLTIIVKVIFWPVTHKSTESMKRMQKIQPLVTEIREKYKDKPQKMNKEVMALYKEHKVNPMMGCLPMLIQIPVFFALFTVLRSAVELRFAEFLWIKDLSEPERLIEFGFAIPLIGWDSLNILPLTMTATMIWQQKLTPAAGDPQQQKMMMIFMPIMMLFFLYNMASALMLYWTVSQCLSIAQMLMQKRKTAREEAAAHHSSSQSS